MTQSFKNWWISANISEGPYGETKAVARAAWFAAIDAAQQESLSRPGIVGAGPAVAASSDKHDVQNAAPQVSPMATRGDTVELPRSGPDSATVVSSPADAAPYTPSMARETPRTWALKTECDRDPAGRYRKALGLAGQLERELEGFRSALATALGKHLAERSATPQTITQNDKRWRFLEHGCQWVSFIPINGRQRSFDPRNMTGYQGDLQDMRGTVDEELEKQLKLLREEAEKEAAKLRRSDR